MSYQRPLLATDLSPGSQTAARFLPLILDKGVRGLLAHVVAAPELPVDIPMESAALARSVLATHPQIERQIIEQAVSCGLLGWSAIVDYGPVGATLARIAREEGCDVIALGSLGAGRIARAFLGSTARSVARQASVDTLVVRAGAEPRLDRIIVATDLQAPSRLAAKRARELALQHGSRVTLIYAVEPGLFAGALYPSPPEGRFGAEWLTKHVLSGLGRLNREFFGGVAEETLVNARAAAGVVKAAAELRADLVMVGSHGGGVVSRLLLGSVAGSIVADAPCSVLVVRT